MRHLRRTSSSLLLPYFILGLMIGILHALHHIYNTNTCPQVQEDLLRNSTGSFHLSDSCQNQGLIAPICHTGFSKVYSSFFFASHKASIKIVSKPEASISRGSPLYLLVLWLVFTWLVFTLISPALLNLFVQTQEPLPNRTEMIHAVRSLNDKNWESPKTFVLDKFYKAYPAYNDGDTTNFDKWYYASFTVIDDEAAQLNAQFESQVAKRNKLLKQWEWLAPAAMLHERLSQISGTDRASHQAFVKDLQSYHSQLKEMYYTKIFQEETFSTQDLEKINTLLVQ